jgi:hypothetical protein
MAPAPAPPQPQSLVALFRLPPEIRAMIWPLLLDEPRLIQLRVKNLKNWWTSRDGRHAYLKDVPSDPSKIAIVTTVPTAIPLLLHICQESRCYGLIIYRKLSLGGYFNFLTDTLLISPDVFPVFGAHGGPPPLNFPLLLDRESRSLQHIAFYFPKIPIHRQTENAPAVASYVYRMSCVLSGLHTLAVVSDEDWLVNFTHTFETEWEDMLDEEWQHMSWRSESPPELKFFDHPSLRTPERKWRCYHREMVYLCRTCGSDIVYSTPVRRGSYPTPF